MQPPNRGARCLTTPVDAAPVGCAARTVSVYRCARRTLRVLVATSLLAITPQAIANPPAAFTETLQATWVAPRSADFVYQSRQLTPALQALCTAAAAEPALTRAREHWLAALGSWETLSAVAFGPVLERRSQRQIDFTPTRPRLIEKAIKTAPADAAAMELIGTPAKGLPALEWLLWMKPVQPAGADCRYAIQVAAEIEREATALAETRLSSPDDQATLSELVNQWVGGLERLRWGNLEMPARVSQTSGGKDAPEYPRQASGAHAASWAAQWRALRELAIGPVSLASALNQRGKSALPLTTAVERADTALQGLTGDDLPRAIAAGRELAALKRLVENQVAADLGVNIGFSDADGD